MTRRRGGTVGVALAALLCLGAAASDPAERLQNPVQEVRARALFRQIRCLVCQNQSIDESDADLADDLRRIVRQDITAGRTDAEIRRFLVRRYGEFVLLRPRFSPANAVLWLTPFAIVGVGAVAIGRRRRGGSDLEAPLTDAEQARLEVLAADSRTYKPAAAAMLPPHGRLTDDHQT